MARPQAGEYAPFHEAYISLTLGDSIPALMTNHSEDIARFIQSLPDDKGDYAYEPGKWTIKQVIQHLIDTERIMTYRAVRFARKDQTQLEGFDQDQYAANAATASRTMQSLKDEFAAVRKAGDIFFTSLQQDELNQSGVANKNAVTVNAFAFIIFGHTLHHIAVIKARYL